MGQGCGDGIGRISLRNPAIELNRRSRDLALFHRKCGCAYLLAFSTVAGLKLVTFDRALHSRGSEVSFLGHPFGVRHWPLQSQEYGVISDQTRVSSVIPIICPLMSG